MTLNEHADVHVLHSHAAALRCLRGLALSRLIPARIILTSTAITALDDDTDEAKYIHELAGLTVEVVVIAGDLPALGLDLQDLPAHIYTMVDLQTAVLQARAAGHRIYHWL